MNAVPDWRAARVHLWVIAALYALVIPVAVLDQRELNSGGGDWISLDLRGLFVGAYLIAVGVVATILLIHMSVKKLKQRFSFGLLVACSVGPACFVPLGYGIYQAIVR